MQPKSSIETTCHGKAYVCMQCSSTVLVFT